MSQPLRLRRLLAALVLAIIAALGPSAQAQAPDARPRAAAETGPTAALRPGDRLPNLYARMVPVADIDTPCPRVATEPPMSERAPEGRSWGCMHLTNAGDRTAIWRIDTEQSAVGGFAFYVVRANSDQRVLSADWPFASAASRERPARLLSSLPIPVAPGEAVEIWVRLQTGIVAARTIPQLEPANEHLEEATRGGWRDGAFLAAGLSLTLFFAAFSALLRSTPAARYAVYFGCLLLNHLNGAGYLTWTLTPGFMSLSLLLASWLQLAVVVAYLRFVAAFMDAHYQRHRIQRIIRILIGVAIAFTVLEIGLLLLAPETSHFKTMVALLFAGVSLWAAAVALRDRKQGSGLFAAGALVLFFYVALGVVIANYVLGPSQLGWIAEAVLALQILDGLIFAAAVTRQTFALRADRDRALEAELDASRERLRLSETLLSARRDLDQARSLAERHRERLALTSHDLRQPLTSLRLALQEAEATSPELRDKLASSLDYLKSVLNESLLDARPAPATAPRPAQAPEAEELPLQLILDNVERMFADEARARGLELRCAPSALVASAPPVAVIRMLSNLVSNAVKYAPPREDGTGGVLIGARPHGDALRLVVYDTGPGLTPAEIDQITESYRRGAGADGVEGEGVGLSSVARLAAESGARLTIRSTPGRGSAFAIEGLPRLPSRRPQPAGAPAKPLSAQTHAE